MLQDHENDIHNPPLACQGRLERIDVPSQAGPHRMYLRSHNDDGQLRRTVEGIIYIIFLHQIR